VVRNLPVGTDSLVPVTSLESWILLVQRYAVWTAATATRSQTDLFWSTHPQLTMFDHIVHLQALHINWGATEVRSSRKPASGLGGSRSMRRPTGVRLHAASQETVRFSALRRVTGPLHCVPRAPRVSAVRLADRHHKRQHARWARPCRPHLHLVPWH